MLDEMEDFFVNTKSVKCEGYKQINARHEENKTLQSFHAALTAQAARSELRTVETELLIYRST